MKGSKETILQLTLRKQSYNHAFSKEIYDLTTLIPKPIQTLPHQYLSISSIDLPNELPLLRGNKHQINLQPRVTLPYLPYYHISLKEH